MSSAHFFAAHKPEIDSVGEQIEIGTATVTGHYYFTYDIKYTTNDGQELTEQEKTDLKHSYVEYQYFQKEHVSQIVTMSYFREVEAVIDENKVIKNNGFCHTDRE